MFFSDSVEIQAPPERVWKALVEERRFFKSEVSNVVGDTYHLHQEFPTPIGAAKFNFLIVEEHPYRVMNFLSLDSNAVSSLKGQWNLIKLENATVLQLKIDKMKIKVQFLIS